MSKTIKELIREVHAIARSKGWWPALKLDRVRNNDPATLGSSIALLHSEASEALECVRNGGMETVYKNNGKPEGFLVELADLEIRIWDLVCAMDETEAYIDALEDKIAYNRTRPHRHGNKAL